MKLKYSKLILFTLIAVLITDSFRLIGIVGALSVDSSTYISSALIYLSLLIIILIAYKSRLDDGIPKSILNIFKLWLFWNIFSLAHGIFLANSYWDWKFLFLSSFSFSLIPLVFFYGKDITIVKIIFKFVLKFIFPLGFLVVPLALATNEELYSRLMIPISLFILFIPYLKFKWKLLIFLVVITSILIAIGFRSNIIKIAFSLMLLIIYYFQRYISQNWLRFAHLSLFATPVLLITLAITGSFNIFKEMSTKEEYYTTNKEGKEENYMGDSRTFIYVEILSSLNKTGNWIFGEGACGTYTSSYFYNEGGAMKGKRYGSEVGLLNILLRNGIIGVLIYTSFLFCVSFVAINHSSNILAKLLGLFIAFRWTFSFVEEFTQYDLNFYFFWLIIGLVSTNQFRSMNDEQLKELFIFK